MLGDDGIIMIMIVVFPGRISQYHNGLPTKVGVTEERLLVQVFSYKRVQR